MSQRFGHVALVGRPNVGKSTLLNALIGEPLAIVTHKPQTTRDQILGLFNDARGQIAFVDTPGIHKRKDHSLNRRLNRLASASLASVDVVVAVVDARHEHDEDERVFELLDRIDDRPRLLVINKIDTLSDRAALLPRTDALMARLPFDAVVYTAATRGDGVEDLLTEVFARLPEGAPAYDDSLFTDRSMRFLAAEAVREQLMLNLHQEIPYGLTVVIERYETGPRRTEIDALVVVNEARHKGMVIGRGGEVLKRVGSLARRRIEALVGGPVHLALHVKVKSGWLEDEALLEQFSSAT